jgi:hypothetical protein
MDDSHRVVVCHAHRPYRARRRNPSAADRQQSRLELCGHLRRSSGFGGGRRWVVSESTQKERGSKGTQNDVLISLIWRCPLPSCGRYQAMENGVADESGDIMYSKPVHKCRSVRIDRFKTRVQCSGNVFGGMTFRYKLQYFALTRR